MSPDLERDKEYLGFVSQFDRTTYDLSPEQNQEWAFVPEDKSSGESWAIPADQYLFLLAEDVLAE